MGLFLAISTPAWAVMWNGTNASYSATSTSGLSDNYDQFVDENIVSNGGNSTRGTGTYLGNGWVLTAQHVVQGSGGYGTLASPSQITMGVYANSIFSDYTANEISTPNGLGGPDIALIHFAGYTSGEITTLPGVNLSQIYTGSSETNQLVQIGGFGYWGELGGTENTSEEFYRAFNIASASGGFVNISANASTRLVTDAYVMGIAEPGDSGSAMWMDTKSDSDTNLADWDLIGVCDTSNGTAFGDSNQYARVSDYAASWILPTVYGVPEPTTLGLILLCGGTFLTRRRSVTRPS